MRDPGFIINPPRIKTDGGCRNISMQMLQILALLPDINFGTSVCCFPQKLQFADAFVFSFANKPCLMQSKQM